MHIPLRTITSTLACLLLAATAIAQEGADAPAKTADPAASPVLAGYLKHEQLTAAIQKLDESELATIRSLGKSGGPRRLADYLGQRR